MKGSSFQYVDIGNLLNKIISKLQDEAEKKDPKDSALQLAIKFWVEKKSSDFEFDPEFTKQLKKECESIVSKEGLEVNKELAYEKRSFWENITTAVKKKFSKSIIDLYYKNIALYALHIVNTVIIMMILKKDQAYKAYNTTKDSYQGKPKTNSFRTAGIKPENFIFTVVVYETEKNLLDELQTNKRLTPETAKRLLRAKQWVGYSLETEFDQNCRNLFKSSSDNEPNEYDVRFVKIILNQPDERLSKNSTLLKMSDAFKDLGKQEVAVEVSPRHPKESYENKGFYSL